VRHDRERPDSGHDPEALLEQAEAPERAERCGRL
jgi:hypothetical protein